jgi:hypothetical protein
MLRFLLPIIASKKSTEQTAAPGGAELISSLSASEEQAKPEQTGGEKKRGQIELTSGKHDPEHDQGDSAHQQKSSGQLDPSNPTSPLDLG